MQLAQEDIDSLALDMFDLIKNTYYAELDEYKDFDLIMETLETHLDKFSIGYRNYN